MQRICDGNRLCTAGQGEIRGYALGCPLLYSTRTLRERTLGEYALLDQLGSAVPYDLSCNLSY
jgi:hypothetical protein